MKKGFSVSLAFLLVLAFFPFRAHGGENDVASAAFSQGAEAFRSGEWMSAVFMLRRAVAYPENFNQETWYMLITAEMYAGEYRSAFQDAETYLKSFPDSIYESHVMYHKGRALFYLGEYERAVLLLGDFCHLHPDHEMYAAALFWIAESFYATYNYKEAAPLYSRIVNEFPDDPKAGTAQYRLGMIAQSEREEKLLYLLKETGEEYLAAKEEYERLLKISGSDGAADIRRRIMDLQMRNAELEKKISELDGENSSLKDELSAAGRKISDFQSRNDEILNALKMKARTAEQFLQKKEAEGERK